jgi:citrate lyase beta subunit
MIAVTFRSLLFVPGDDPAKLVKALASEADAVIADLEDSVAPASKARAREGVAAAFSTDSRPRRLVRVNAAETDEFEQDMELIAQLNIDGIVLPKATPESVALLPAGAPPVIALIETGRGLDRSRAVAEYEGVVALALGGEDLRHELRQETRPDELEILFARSALVVSSAAAGVAAPIDVVHTRLDDLDGLERSASLARSLGFRGKFCIHPAQVPIVNRVFAPTAFELDWAHRVVAAYEASEAHGRGVLSLDGEMIDAPVIARARRVLNDSEGITQ